MTETPTRSEGYGWGLSVASLSGPVILVTRHPAGGGLGQQPLPNGRQSTPPVRPSIPREELGRLASERVAQRIQRPHIHARGIVHQPQRRGLVDPAFTDLRQLVGGLDAAGLHQFRQSQSHIQHDTNVTTEVARRNSVSTLAVVRKYV
jgi:hypothetical protein